jgi:hypothetical protein
MNNVRHLCIYVKFATVLLITLGGCSSKITLKPNNDERQSTILQDNAVVNFAGIRIMAEPGVWFGPENDGKQIVPIRITIANNSEFPMLIRYSDFYIVGIETGNVYPALPPYFFDPAEEADTVKAPGVTTSKNYFDCEKFGVAPYNAWMYPDLPEWTGMFTYERMFYNLYYQLWAKKKLYSVNELVRSEIPEGVLLNNGFMHGFIYFETFKKHEKKVVLNFRICEARRGLVFQSISIPFIVKH